MKKRICLYYLKPAPSDRWFSGDHKIRAFIRQLLRGKDRISSLELVFLNLCEGFKKIGVDFTINLPFKDLRPSDVVIVLGQGKYSLENYNKENPIIAGIGLMTHPNDWPTLFKDYPVKTYLQHSEWTAAIYNRWFGPNTCKIWPAGIDVDFWKPVKKEKKSFLVYEKFLWDKEINQKKITAPIIQFLKQQNLSYQLIRYGDYTKQSYKDLLEDSLGMIFLCEHESQGLAYQEAMAMDVPILAWDQGLWLDTNRFMWGEENLVPATSVPYFSEECGMKFKTLSDFNTAFPNFYESILASKFNPRAYVLANLTLEKSAERILAIINEVS